MLALRYSPENLSVDLAPDDDADSDLVTELLLALLTDARVDAGELPEGVDNRGWWDDDLAGSPLGSRLWLLEHGVPTAETARRAEQYAQDALAYLKRDGRAQNISTLASLEGDRLTLSVRIDGIERVRLGLFR